MLNEDITIACIGKSATNDTTLCKHSDWIFTPIEVEGRRKFTYKFEGKNKYLHMHILQNV